MRIYGSSGLTFLNDRKVAVTAGWQPLSAQLQALRQYTSGLDATTVVSRIPSEALRSVRSDELEQTVPEHDGHLSLAFEHLSPAATAVANWRPLFTAAAVQQPGAVFDALAPIREWRTEGTEVPSLSVIEYEFYDIEGFSFDEVDKKIDLYPHESISGHEIALSVYLNGDTFIPFLRESGYKIIAGGVTLPGLSAFRPRIEQGGVQGVADLLRVLPQRTDVQLGVKTLLPIITHRSILVRL